MASRAEPNTNAEAEASKGETDDVEDLSAAPEKFSPEEEQALLGESNGKKAEANSLFSSAKFENAIAKYEEAAAICPHYLDYELAVLKSNIAACHLKLEQWKEAIGSATTALEGLDRVEKAEVEEAKTQEEDDEVEEEIVSAGAQKSAPAPADDEDVAAAAQRKRKEDVLRIRAKALMRRGRARSELGGWSNLSAAEEDYKTLSKMNNLSSPDRKTVAAQLRTLPARTKQAQEQEMGEMWGKLKDLGNGLLKPFGLSTDNFQFTKDDKSGGYSMNFNQNSGA